MKKLAVFTLFAFGLAAIDLYLFNCSPYIAAGLAAGYLVEKEER